MGGRGGGFHGGGGAEINPEDLFNAFFGGGFGGGGGFGQPQSEFCSLSLSLSLSLSRMA
jgi:DnaJ family protein B protein 12